MSESPAQLRSRRRWQVGLVLIPLVLAASGALFWFLRAGATLSAVEVLPHQMRCYGETVPATVVDDPFGDGPPRPTLSPRLRPGSPCTLTVTVHNGGSRTVSVRSMTFPDMMPGATGRFLLETRRDEFQVKPHEDDESGDAIFDVDVDVGPGESRDLSYRIAYRVDGLTCPGGISGTGGFPIASVSADGRPGHVTGSVLLVHETVETIGNRGNCG